MNYQMPYYNLPPYKYTPSMYQVNMLNSETGQVVNCSTIFYRDEELNWYLASIGNLSTFFKILVCYQTCDWKNKYEYEIKQGTWIYNPPSLEEYVPPPKFEYRTSQTEPTEPEAEPEPKQEAELNSTYRQHATSGFNFHFDPPQNLNLVVNPENLTSHESEDNFTHNDENVGPENDLTTEHYVAVENEGNSVNVEVVNDSLGQQEEDPDYNPENDIHQLLNDIEDDFDAPNFVASSTPPPLEEDHWDVIQNNPTFEDMTIEKYGRGYILKADEEHPDYGIKYYPSEENCRAWWQEANKGWFVQRENKNFFLERGAVFIHHNSQNNKRKLRKRNKRHRY